MKPIYRTLIVITSLIFTGALVALCFVGIKYLIDQYPYRYDALQSPVFIISAVIVMCTFILSRSVYSLSNRMDKNIHPEKAVVYGNFIEIRNEMAAGSGLSDIQIKRLQNQRKQMLLWAADDVLKEFLKLEKLIAGSATDNRLLPQVEKIILCMRRDLGNSNLGILRGDLAHILTKN